MYDDPYWDSFHLRDVLETTAHEVMSAQDHLYEAIAEFNRVALDVIEVVGGSAQRVDQEMVASLEEAKARTDAALDALAMVHASLHRLN